MRDVLHRLLPGRQRPSDDEDPWPWRALTRGELDHMQRCAADVQPCDRVHDRERAGGRHAACDVRERCRAGASAPTRPNVARTASAIGCPRRARTLRSRRASEASHGAARYAASSSGSPRGQRRTDRSASRTASASRPPATANADDRRARRAPGRTSVGDEDAVRPREVVWRADRGSAPARRGGIARTPRRQVAPPAGSENGVARGRCGRRCRRRSGAGSSSPATRLASRPRPGRTTAAESRARCARSRTWRP